MCQKGAPNLLEPDFVWTVGDLIQGYNTTEPWIRQMEEYKGVMDELLCPWFPVAGNHDVYWRGEGKPEGVPRFEAAGAECPLRFDVAEGGVLVSTPLVGFLLIYILISSLANLLSVSLKSL